MILSESVPITANTTVHFLWGPLFLPGPIFSWEPNFIACMVFYCLLIVPTSNYCYELDI